jgi:hypothetical protein
MSSGDSALNPQPIPPGLRPLTPCAKQSAAILDEQIAGTSLLQLMQSSRELLNARVNPPHVVITGRFFQIRAQSNGGCLVAIGLR